jgi:snurportin-1
MLNQDVRLRLINDSDKSLPPVVLEPQSKKSKKKRKNKNKPNKWADKCMYAELLEMVADPPWPSSMDNPDDGLPGDLESSWVAVGPVPVGKRCLAVTHQAAGIAGNGVPLEVFFVVQLIHVSLVPNTTLRSRLLGKVLIQRFPSALPPLTILDCILDSNWRENGILHILDVIKWKGQDVSDCEASFRQVCTMIL